MSGSIFMIYFLYILQKTILEDSTLINFGKTPDEKFDAVIVEWFFGEVSAGLAPFYECPLIWFGSTEAFWRPLELVDEIPNPAYSVDIFSNNRPPLNFAQRVEELWNLLKQFTIKSIIFKPLEMYMYSYVYPEIALKRGVTMPSYNEAVYNGSFLLINSHPSIGSSYRLPQNAKYIGGYHIDNKVKDLPKDLQKLMDEAKYGVIYFSFGSNAKSADMSDQMKESLLEEFGKLKQLVIWKFEADLLNTPPNVHLVKWAPQQSILAHPNLKIFITHGGQLSTTEAIHFAVPLIGIPLGADQYINMKSVVNKGFGIYVELTEAMPSDLGKALIEMLSTEKYKTKAQELSLIYHDRRNPGEELVYWVEHVIKTGGAPHLRSPALHVPFYKKMFLDVAALVLLLVLITAKIAKKFYQIYRQKKSSKEKTT